jgi:hypothetical protein
LNSILFTDLVDSIFYGVPGMALNLAVEVRYGGTYRPTIREAQAIHREVEVKEAWNKILARRTET